MRSAGSEVCGGLLSGVLRALHEHGEVHRLEVAHCGHMQAAADAGAGFRHMESHFAGWQWVWVHS